MTHDPAFPVAQQLAAYNRRDIDAFMRWWASDCAYYAFPDTLLAHGAAAIRARHEERFLEPDLHAELLGRTVIGTLVVDHERVRRNFPKGSGTLDVICLYEVEDGLIVRAWFRTGEHRLDARAPPG